MVLITRPPWSEMIAVAVDSNVSTIAESSSDDRSRLRRVKPTMSAKPIAIGTALSALVASSRPMALARWRRQM